MSCVAYVVGCRVRMQEDYNQQTSSDGVISTTHRL